MRGHDDEITTLLRRGIDNALIGMRIFDVHRVTGDTRSRCSLLCRRKVLGRTSRDVLLIPFPRIGNHAGLDGKGLKRLKLQEMGRKTFHGYLKQIDGMLSGRQWFADGKYTVLDPYGFVFYTWGVRRELPMAELKNYSAFKDRMLERPAVRRVVEDEKLKV